MVFQLIQAPSHISQRFKLCLRYKLINQSINQSIFVY